MTYQCSYCNRNFSTPRALKIHISQKHQYTTDDEDKGETSHSKTTYKENPEVWSDDEGKPYEEDPSIWCDDDDDDERMQEPEIRDDDLPTEDPMVRFR